MYTYQNILVVKVRLHVEVRVHVLDLFFFVVALIKEHNGHKFFEHYA